MTEVTRCCSTDSEQPHHCCHPVNNFESHRIFPIVNNGPIDAPKIVSSSGGSGSPPNTWLLGPNQVQAPNGISAGSAILAQLMVVTNRQTDRQTDTQICCICSNRPHLRTDWMRSALMITLHFTDTQHSCDFRLHASDHTPTELQQHSRMQHQLHNRLRTIQSSCNRQQFPRAPTTRSMTPLTSLQTRNPAAYVSGGSRRGSCCVRCTLAQDVA